MKTTLVLLATLCMSIVVSAQTSDNWSSAEALQEWRRVGRKARSFKQDLEGVEWRFQPNDEPHTIVSPTLSLAAPAATTLRLTYLLELRRNSSPRLEVRWLSNVQDGEQAEECAVSTPLVQGYWNTIELSLEKSPCWTNTATVQQVAITVAGLARTENGAMRIHNIELTDSVRP